MTAVDSMRFLSTILAPFVQQDSSSLTACGAEAQQLVELVFVVAGATRMLSRLQPRLLLTLCRLPESRGAMELMALEDFWQACQGRHPC